MSESRDDNGPVRIPDHDLDDLAATVNALLSQSQQHAETLARLTDEGPTPEEGELGAERGREATTAPEQGSDCDEPSSPSIFALQGRAYAKELAALADWVHDLLLPVYGREITASRPWCRQWTEHPEAVARLHALWLAWQQYTDSEAGLAGPSIWHRDHLDPALHQLRAADGPFGACTTTSSRPNHRLLAAPEPLGTGDCRAA
ncbi:DUF4913 domain-containing protein [Streptomyces sp. Ru73]|uniref:DUF4913 domain-containing protein n=1 Tax=Streptomyces sp. Ru73 TaxID=2080748 RepID=UPI000CDD9A7E|nr:DUF4913 domain-containing protein [Streptomyces sp. Ru73]POX43392.1 DUF4913 domain-containing protein [Streptomyces sp. Ru73]